MIGGFSVNQKSNNKNYMKKFLLTLCFITSMMWGLACPAIAQKAIDITQKYPDTIGQHFQVYRTTDAPIDFSVALEAYQNGLFSSVRHSIINFGIDSKPIWLALSVSNPSKTAIYRNLLFETSWLDKIDIYFSQHDQITNIYHLGDSEKFSQRSLNHRFFVTSHHFEPGNTIVLIRIESVDAMVLPIYFMSNDDLENRKTLQSYSYGLVYGAILGLIAYNLMLYLGLRSSLYLYYSIYLLSFLVLNISYTGHGYQWIWPELPQWQQWANPLLILTCSISGLIFAVHFLNVRQTLPRMYWVVIASCLGSGALIPLLMQISSYAFTLQVSLAIVFLSSALMIILGIMVLQKGDKLAKYYLIASASRIMGGTVTGCAIWEIIPFNWLTYRATEIGIMADAILLALALAERFNINQKERLIAEKMADIDALTNLNNRRSFYKFVKPIWSLSLRNRSHASVIMVDVDDFKLFNDNYGHALGDLILIRLAETLRKEARSGDILTRWGGEEFLIFLPETKLTDAVTFAERVRKRISMIELAPINQKKFTFTASFGVAHNKNIVSLDELISIADQQLYSAKKQGRNCVCAHHTS